MNQTSTVSHPVESKERSGSSIAHNSSGTAGSKSSSSKANSSSNAVPAKGKKVRNGLVIFVEMNSILNLYILIFLYIYFNLTNFIYGFKFEKNINLFYIYIYLARAPLQISLMKFAKEQAETSVQC